MTVLLLLSTSVGACVVPESSDGAVSQPDQPILFRGYTTSAAQRVTLQARDDDGGFETFAITHAGRSPRRLRDGSSIYAWRVEAVVPHWHGLECGRTAEVRALGKVRGHDVPLFAYQEASAACLERALDRGVPIVRAMRECADATGGVFELRAGGSVHVGDVTVTTQAEADALACVTSIEGSLTVQPVEPLIQLPALAAVSGDVLIEVDDLTSMMFSPAEQVELPVLSSIGGALRYHHFAAPGSYGSDVRIGLPALTELHGALELGLSSFNGYNRGLNALVEVDGDVHITGRGDYYPLDLLQNLERVTGNVTVETSGAGSSGGILPRVTQVGGDLELLSLRRVAADSFEALETVGGVLRMRNSYAGEPTFPQLTQVARGLFLEDGVEEASPGPIVLGSASGLTLGALTIANTELTILPLSAATQVDATGAISVHDNTGLCQATVDAFVGAQRAAGWMGALTASGNTGMCVP